VAFYGPQKGLVMLSRIRDRLKRLEGQTMPQARVFVFVSEEPNLQPRADRLAAFKAKNGVGPGDTIHEVSVTFS
jgi:hypothetical protein